MKKLAILLTLMLSCAAASAQGCIFLFPDFTKADFSFRRGDGVSAAFNFDTKGQKLYYIDGDDIMEMTNVERIEAVTVGFRKFVFHKGKFCEYIHSDKGDIFINWHLRDSFVGKQGAMGLTTQGKVEVLEVPGLNSEYSFDNIGKYEDKTDVWVTSNENEYFFTLDGEEYTFRRLGEIYKAFPDKAAEIKAFVRKNRISLKNTREALAVIYYIYSL